MPLRLTCLLVLLISTFIFALPNPTPAQAANIIVDGTICTLPDAIIAANTDAATGGCIAGSGADMITLDANFSTAIPYPTSTYIHGGQSALPDITSVITIQAGGGNTIARTNGNIAPYFRLLNVTSTGNLTLNGITVTGGYLYLDPMLNEDAVGGGIRSVGALTVNNSTITANTIDNKERYPFGGGIYALGSIPTVINNSTISYNSGTGEFLTGAGIYLENGIVTNSTISHNEGTGYYFTFGAGIAGDTLTITQSVISSNTLFSPEPEDRDYMPQGAGIMAVNLTLTRSIIENNAIHAGQADGIAIFAQSATVTDSLIRGNVPTSEIIYGSVITAGDFNLINSTLSGNLNPNEGITFIISLGSGASTIRNSTIANNNDPEAVSVYIMGDTLSIGSSIFTNCWSQGTVMSLGYNLVEYGGGNCVFNGTGDQVNVDPLLAPLANNGGFTQTHALLEGSPAIDAGTCVGGTVTTDQRGVSRPYDDPGIANTDDGCDIGAFERNTLSPTLTPSDTPVFTATDTATDVPSHTPTETATLATMTEEATPTKTYTNTATIIPSVTSCISVAIAPNLVSPEHRSHTTDRTPTFTWNPVNNAKSYRLMVYTEDRSFEYKKRTFNTSYTLTNAEALTPAKYLWRVRTQDNTCDTWTTWSQRNTLFID